MMYLAPQGKNSREDGDIEFGSDGTQGKPPREKLKGEVEIKLNRKKSLILLLIRSLLKKVLYFFSWTFAEI